MDSRRCLNIDQQNIDVTFAEAHKVQLRPIILMVHFNHLSYHILDLSTFNLELNLPFVSLKVIELAF